MSDTSLPRVRELGIVDQILDLFENRIAVVNVDGQEHLSTGATLVESGEVHLHIASMAEGSPVRSLAISREELHEALILNSQLITRSTSNRTLVIQFVPYGYVDLRDLCSKDGQSSPCLTQELWTQTLGKLRDANGRPVDLTEMEVKSLHHELSTERSINYICSIRLARGQRARGLKKQISILADYNRPWSTGTGDAHALHELLIKPLFLTD